MRHGISEQQWLEYVDGTLSEREVARLRTHLLICAECAEVPIELNEWRELMLKEARTLRGNVLLSELEIESLLVRSIERIRQQAPPVIRNSFRWSTAEGMLLLRSLMEPICGLGTARATMTLAARRSTADDESRITERNWRLFVANLSDAIASVCGSAAGRLISRAGACLAIEEA